MDYFPLFADLRDQACLVVGGGPVAARKIRLLRAAGARVTVCAPKLCAAVTEMRDAGELRVHNAPFAAHHIGEHLLIVAATSDPACNVAVAAAARAARRLCNVVDDPVHCSFIMPAIVDRGPVTVAISTGGRSPTLARWLKARLERFLPARIGDAAALTARWRNSVRASVRDAVQRQRFWLDVLAGPVMEHLLAGRHGAAEQAMTRALSGGSGAVDYRGAPRGEAWLVGAGPGEAELITLRGANLLSRADVVLHDSLVSASVLELARRDAELINVGKRAGRHSMTQDDITALLIRRVQAGQRVCRLKGGDPLLFGRGGEEALALRAAGLDFQIVPGVTAASACGAYAGIPLTHRGVAEAVTFVTAHGCRPDHEPDWRALAAARQTVVFYMGIRRVRQIGRRLIEHGRARSTPVAIIENGSTREQKTRLATLQQLADGQIGDVASPAAIVVGEVVVYANVLAWFDPNHSDATLLEPLPTDGMPVPAELSLTARGAGRNRRAGALA